MKIITTYLVLSAACHAATAWCDFDQKPVSEQWQTRGNATVEDAKVSGAPAGGPTGKAMGVTSTGRALIASRTDNLALADLQDCETLSFWVRRDEGSADPLVLDMMFLEKDRKAAFWRKVEITGDGWQQIDMPLNWFRWETGRVPLWNEMKHFAIRTRGPAGFAIDDISLIDRDPAAGADYTVQQLAELAFGKDAPNVRIHADDSKWILTNQPELDMEKLASHLETVRKAVTSELKLPEASRPARVIVFADREQYAAFIPRFGEKLGAQAAKPQSTGYHLQGIALSFWDPEFGTLRPVVTHEFVHSILSNYALTDSSHSDWWQEGVANTYQLRWHPQANFNELVVNSLKSENNYDPLETLANGGSVEMNRYWQVATLVAMLREHSEYMDKLPNLLEGFLKTGSTDLRPLLQPVYGKSWDELTNDWKKWTATRYAPVGISIVPADEGELK